VNTTEIRELTYGDRLTHVETGTPAIVETISLWGDGRTEVTVRFGGDPRTDPWGPFREMSHHTSAVRDLERIVIERGQLGEWERA
jgi:hypothetical protein